MRKSHKMTPSRFHAKMKKKYHGQRTHWITDPFIGPYYINKNGRVIARNKNGTLRVIK